MSIRPMEWAGNCLRLLDQRSLPASEQWLECRTWQDIEIAIKDMAVRGAPAIGVAAAYGVALAALQKAQMEEAFRGLAASRPTAVNLFWALDRLKALGTDNFDRLLQEARSIEAEDVQANLAIGHHGMTLLPNPATVLTICNTGALATAGHGTALGIIRSAHYEGQQITVYSCETRPRQQGLRLTAWELMKEDIPFFSIADGAAGALMKRGGIDAVIVGADRIAANGDAANKIGTYALAVLAKHHGVPFYVAAPMSTVDPSTPTGAEIPIEERSSTELTHIEGVAVAPEGCPVWNPAFDVTPSELITAIVTEEGVLRAPYGF